jgi:hypothetical protein
MFHVCYKFEYSRLFWYSNSRDVRNRTNIYLYKVVPVHSMKLRGGGGLMAPLNLKRQMRVIGHLHSSVTLLKEKAPPPPTEYEAGWVPNRRTGRLAEVINPLPISGI